MYGRSLVPVFEALRCLGLVESERGFGRWIGRGPDYLRDHRRAGGQRRVSSMTISRLRRQLVEVSHRTPPGLASEIETIIAALDRDLTIARMLSR